MRFDPDRLDAFLSLLPRDTAAARTLARRHDRRVEGRAWLPIDRPRPLRHAVEPATRASATPPSSSCCAATRSRWSAPTASTGRG